MGLICYFRQINFCNIMAPHLGASTRYQVLGVKKAVKKPKEIAVALNIHVSSVYTILKKAEERDGCLEDTDRSGRPCTAITQRNVDALRKRIQRNPTKSIRAMSRERLASP